MDDVSDNAVFCLDFINEGCLIHVSNRRTLLCRPNGIKWDNVLVAQIVRFPDREVVDEVIGSIYSKVWIEPEDWEPLNIEPNISQDQAYGILYSIMQVGRGLSEEQMKRFINTCSGNKFSEARIALGL